MAKIFYLLKQNKNQGSKIFGKWFAHGKTIETLNTRKMANHICLIEMLLESKRVKIDGLGIFYTTLENEKGGAPAKEDFNPTKNLKALHIRFLPDQVAETNISSREFIKKAEFVNAEALAGQLLENGSGNTPSGGGSQGGGTYQPGHDNPGEGD